MVLKCAQNAGAATLQESAEARKLDGKWGVKFTNVWTAGLRPGVKGGGCPRITRIAANVEQQWQW